MPPGFGRVAGSSLVNVRDKTATAVFPTAAPNERLDATTYPTCPGPLDAEQREAFTSHGLYLQPGADAVHTLYVVHHGSREAIEVFEVDAGAAPPAFTWVGMRASAVDYSYQWCGRSAWGRRSGHKWGDRKRVGVARRCGVDADTGYRRHGAKWTGDSRGTGAGCTLPGGARRSSRACRLIRRRCRLTSSSWDSGLTIYGCRSNGTALLAAGHTDKDGQSIVEPREPLLETSNVSKIDPETLEVERIFEHPSMEGFVASTTAIQIGNELWLGSARGERIAAAPVPE